MIDLLQPANVFLTPTADFIDGANAKVLGEAVYSVKKLIVFLNTKDIEVERVRREHESTGGDRCRRTYPHSIVQAPFEAGSRDCAEGTGGSAQRRKRHLVRGYVYGKGTRPIEQQRWVAPYWRGDQEIDEIKRDHYKVG